MYKVTKRDGRTVDFNITRIANAITKAFDATQIPYNPDIINMLSLQVTSDYACKVMVPTWHMRPYFFAAATMVLPSRVKMRKG